MPVYTLPPAPEDIADLADRALAAMPDVLRRQVRGVSILVEEVADDETLGELGIENAWELTGLYRGVPLGHKDAGGTAHAPDLSCCIASRSCWNGSRRGRTCSASSATC